MLWRLALISLAGCGRIGFEVASQQSDGSTDGADGSALGHDEDGDGIPDTTDVCPYVADSQVDTDGDRVGDACDPNPTMPRDTIALFSTMGAGDMPFSINTLSTTGGTWTQDADGYHFVSPFSTDNHGEIDLPFSAGDIRVAIGFDILTVGDPVLQHQFALATTLSTPRYYVEINEIIPTYSDTAVTYFDGTQFSGASLDNLATGIHPGSVTFVATERVGVGTRIDASWPGEPYVAEVMDSVYQGATQLTIGINNLDLEIRYVCVITSS